MAGHSSSGVGPTATLFETLEAWRQDRSSVVLANKVDEASAHVERLPTPPKLHRWWTDHASTYDPVTATTLLATLYTQAQAAHVSWRVLVLRATPLVDELRAVGFDVPTGTERPAWLNLVDRIGLMLTWPDDPRVAVALADALHSEAFFGDRIRLRGLHRDPVTRALTAAIVKRVAQIGDLRALGRVSLLWRYLAPELCELVTQVAASAPVPRQGEDADDAAWQAVLEEPDALAPRLVLADAYMQRGDPRGDMIAAQCVPLVAIEKARATGEQIDVSGLFGAAGDRTHALTQANWHRWLGEAALVVGVASRFQGGLLHDVIAGHPGTPPWAWERVAGHRELCALHRLAPGRGVDPDLFASFVDALVHKPRWLRLDDELLRPLHDRGRTLCVSGVELHLPSMTGGLPAIADRVRTVCPQLARLGFSLQASYVASVRELAYRMPDLELRVHLEDVPTLEERAIVDELRALPRVMVFTWGER